MKAAVLRDGRIAMDEVPEPVPAAGQVLACPLVCGICGSDLHARDHASHLCGLLHRAGFRGFMHPARPVVMGHEFCCEIIEPGSSDLPAGARVVALPFLNGPDGVELLGYSNPYYGAFPEQMLLQPEFCLQVPGHVPTDIAALAEPLSVAVHAVAESGAGADAAYAVVGCGPVGLFVIARLRALGLGPVLAVEPNASRRRMAGQLGADLVIAPQADMAEAWWADLGLPLGLSDAMAADPASRKRSRAILFDCVGKPGMLMRIATEAPVGATIVVVGTCMESDAIEPAFLLQKSLRLQFVFAYSPAEFREAFAMICDNPARLSPLITGHGGLASTSDAFDALLAGGDAIKILINADA